MTTDSPRTQAARLQAGALHRQMDVFEMEHGDFPKRADLIFEYTDLVQRAKDADAELACAILEQERRVSFTAAETTISSEHQLHRKQQKH